MSPECGEATGLYGSSAEYRRPSSLLDDGAVAAGAGPPAAPGPGDGSDPDQHGLDVARQHALAAGPRLPLGGRAHGGDPHGERTPGVVRQVLARGRGPAGADGAAAEARGDGREERRAGRRRPAGVAVGGRRRHRVTPVRCGAGCRAAPATGGPYRCPAAGAVLGAALRPLAARLPHRGGRGAPGTGTGAAAAAFRIRRRRRCPPVGRPRPRRCQPGRAGRRARGRVPAPARTGRPGRVRPAGPGQGTRPSGRRPRPGSWPARPRRRCGRRPLHGRSSRRRPACAPR